MRVQDFFQSSTGTLTYVVYDPDSRDAVIIDPSLDFDLSELRLGDQSLQQVVSFIKQEKLKLHWILESHVHADHISGAARLQSLFPEAKMAVGERYRQVQTEFRALFSDAGADQPLGWPFDRLFKDGDVLEVGRMRFTVMATPGHTPACIAFLTEVGVFTGDCLFLPEAGTGRCDFPGGNAGDLFDSVQRLYDLPDATPVFVGHNYPESNQPHCFRSTIGEQKASNIHINGRTKKSEFIQFREQRDLSLTLPRLFYPSLYMNIRGGRWPIENASGRRYITLPLHASF